MTRRSFISIVSVVLFFVLLGNIWQSRQHKPLANQSAQAAVTVPQSLIASLPSPQLGLPARPTAKLTVYARSYIVSDSVTKYPLARKAEDTAVPIASTTKLMTALIALEELDLQQIVTVSRTAATTSGSEIQLMTGEQMSVHNLLYGLLLNSGNDAAVALSEANGTTESFVAKMNDKANVLGMRNTLYKDPAGLDDEGRSSPRDLAILMHHLLNYPEFRTIVKTAKHTIVSADGRFKHELTNSNRLVDSQQHLYMANSLGGKTGFTYDAGHCLVAAAEDANGVRYVAVVLHTVEETKEASAKEARKLLEWAMSGK